MQLCTIPYSIRRKNFVNIKCFTSTLLNTDYKCCIYRYRAVQDTIQDYETYSPYSDKKLLATTLPDRIEFSYEEVRY